MGQQLSVFTSRSSCYVQTERPSYASGEVVKGNIYVNCTAPFVTNGVFLELEGFERAEFRTKRMEGDADNRREIIDVHREHRHFFHQRFPIAPMNGTLMPGQHTFPFEFRIPAGLPGCYHQVGEKFGQPWQASVFYRLEAEVDAMGFFSWDIKHSQPLIVQQALLSSIQAAKASKTANAMLCCCINKGQISMDCTFDKNAYVPGEQATIVASVDNQSEVDVGVMRVKLMRKVVLRARGQSQMDVDVIWEQSYPGVPKGSTLLGGEARRVPLMIPGNVQPATKGQIVFCEYWIDVECDIAWAPDIEIHLPVTIYAPQPPPEQWHLTPPANWNPQVRECVQVVFGSQFAVAAREPSAPPANFSFTTTNFGNASMHSTETSSFQSSTTVNGTVTQSQSYQQSSGF